MTAAPQNGGASAQSETVARLPRIGVTMGDPAGIGPEIVLKAVVEAEARRVCQPVIIGNAHVLSETARRLKLRGEYRIITRDEELTNSNSGDAPLIFHLDNIKGSIEPGVESGEAGRAAAQFIEKAVELCLAKKLDAMSTAPINKRSLHLGGYNFPGHTEFLAHLAKTGESVMAFVAANLRIVLISTHVPLAEAIRLIKRERIARTTRVAARALRSWGIARPRIAVAAVNPHGGEGGLFGTEEAEEILPAIEECRAQGDFEIAGPFSADTIFLRAARGEFDAVIACYHDQAMIPVKCLAFGEAVNVTLGLPFIRTSVDHGTAFDIAGKGVAQHSSMVAAIKLAAELSLKTRQARAAAQNDA
jgi:4-hydroxythreonine-4-phosphate dehydrogenase